MADPRGPRRTILAVRRSPTGGPTTVVLSCGHERERVNHFSYRVGDETHCFGCDGDPTMAALGSWLGERSEAHADLLVACLDERIRPLRPADVDRADWNHRLARAMRSIWAGESATAENLVRELAAATLRA